MATTMIIAGVIALCIVILILAFLAPRLSQHPQRGSQKVDRARRPRCEQGPRPARPLVRKPFQTSNKAVSKSGDAGRKGRGKMPF